MSTNFQMKPLDHDVLVMIGLDQLHTIGGKAFVGKFHSEVVVTGAESYDHAVATVQQFFRNHNSGGSVTISALYRANEYNLRDSVCIEAIKL